MAAAYAEYTLSGASYCASETGRWHVVTDALGFFAGGGAGADSVGDARWQAATKTTTSTATAVEPPASRRVGTIELMRRVEEHRRLRRVKSNLVRTRARRQQLQDEAAEQSC